MNAVQNPDLSLPTDVEMSDAHSTYKGADLQGDIDVPIMSAQPTRRLGRRPRPLHDGSEQWLWDLGALFSEFAAEEAIAGEVFMYVQTWYIDHENHAVCRHPRPLRLEQQSVVWLDEFRYLWRDLMDPDVPFSVYVIRPRPPQYRHHGYTCHVMIDQKRPANRVAGILTALLSDHTRDGIIQAAFSINPFVRIDDIKETLQVQPFCDGRRCTAYYGDQPLHLVIVTELEQAFSVRMHIDPPGLQMPIPPEETQRHFDDLVFMQQEIRPAHRTAALDMPPNSLDLECSQFGTGSQLNPLAPDFVPGGPNIHDESEFVQDLHQVWSQFAFSWESEAPMAQFVTWFVDHRHHYPDCLMGRNVHLSHHFQTWEHSITAVWRDQFHPDLPHEMHLVTPTPPNLEPGVAGHIIVIQDPRDTWVSCLVTVFDSFISARSNHMTRLAVTLDEHISMEQIARMCGYELRHGLIHPNIPCAAWIDRHAFPSGQLWPGRSGHEITFRIDRQIVRIPEFFIEPEDVATLQISRNEPKILDLSSLLPEFSCNQGPAELIPFDLVNIDGVMQCPSTVLLPDGSSEHEIEIELRSLGHDRHAYSLPIPGKFLTIPFAWSAEPMEFHWIYCTDVTMDQKDVILHKSNADLSEHEHMQFLHAYGYLRSVILQVRPLRQNLGLILFHNNTPMLEQPSVPNHGMTPWPDPQPRRSVDTMVSLENVEPHCPMQCLSFDFDFQIIHDFFSSADGILCPWFQHLDIPDHLRSSIALTVQQEGATPDPRDFDRLLIYTDGSSKSKNRHLAPLKAADIDQPDAWAFAVIGETYATEQKPASITFLGWHSQQVMYEPDCRAFAGSDGIGSDYAEREALIFAGLWRLALNSTIPTTFRTDSVTTADQSMGRVGFADLHPAIHLLRSIFQALSAGLPGTDLAVSHVKGHAGDTWNELVDLLAKSEAISSHSLKRQNLDLSQLVKLLPYLWMIIDQNCGLPTVTTAGFDVCPPQLPPVCAAENDFVISATHRARIDLHLSIATFNVGSLYLTPDGFSGKLQYLREQMIAHSLNILGLQEARSAPGLSVVDDILRISSGAQSGHFGVELWISLKQPFMTNRGKAACLKRSNVQLLHHDPRRLIVRVEHTFLNCFFVVLHAPQSGQSDSDRTKWWQQTNEHIACTCLNFPVYVMLDANAKTGPSRWPIVFEHSDANSVSTPLLLSFLDDTGLCLPGTGDMHVGEHGTWTSPDGLHTHRIDFIAIPQEFLDRCTWAGTVPSLDPGHVHQDHIAAAIQLNWSEEHDVKTSGKDSRRPSHKRHQIDRHTFTQAHRYAATCDWTCDIETQVRSINSTIHSSLQELCVEQTKVAKKSFIDEDTWNLRTQKLSLRGRLQFARKQSGLDTLGLFFTAWKGSLTLDALIAHHAHDCRTFCTRFLLQCQYIKLCRILKCKLQQVRTRSLNDTIAKVGPHAPAGTLLHVLKSHLGPSNPKKKKLKCLPIVRRTDGQICQSPTEAQDRWIEHFQHMEGGQRMSHAHYRQLWRNSLADFMQCQPTQIPLTAMPTLCELEWAFRRVQAGKAVGLDAVPPELCHQCPVGLAKLCYPVMLKTAIHGQEAIEHKGGSLAIAWKQKGDVKDCQSHRSLLVSSHLGKTIHRALRQKTHHLYDAYMQHQQLGGKRFMPVAIPLHMNRAFLRWKSRERQPTAVVFLDLTEAFYRIIRPFAVGGPLSDNCIGIICERLGLGSDALHEFYDLLCQPSALVQAKAPEHVQRMLQSLHSDTWFQLGSQNDLVRTEIGSRPGDSFADVVFGLVWATLLRRFESLLVARGIVEHIPDIESPQLFHEYEEGSKPSIPLLGPTWMDDLSVLIAAPDNATLVHRTQLAISLLLDECLRFQMEPNLKRGKTEVMFTFRGRHSRHFRREFYGPNSGLPVVCERQSFHVSIVPRYLHLGGMIHHLDPTKAEIRRRLAIATQAFHLHRRQIYHNPHVVLASRGDIFQSLVMSKLVFGMESWTFASQQTRNLIHSGIIRLYRRFLRVAHDDHIGDLEVLVRTGFPDPTEILRRARLRYFGTIHNCKQHAHWGLLHNDHTWISLIQDDLHWLWTQVGQSQNLGEPRHHFPQWQDIILHYPAFWKKLVRKGIQHACLQRKKEYHAIELHERLGSVLLRANLVPELPANCNIKRFRSQDRKFGCMKCQKQFVNFAGESVHMCRTHQIVAKDRYLFDGTHCPCCLREYHSHSKVLHHLRTSTHCRDVLQTRNVICTPMPGVGSVTDRSLVDLTDGALPMQQSHGPSLPEPNLRPWDDHDIVFLEAFYMHLLDGLEDVDIFTYCRTFILQYPISWTLCQKTLQTFVDRLTPTDAEVLPWPFLRVIECGQLLCQSISWAFLRDLDSAVRSVHPASISEWEQWFGTLACSPPDSVTKLEPLPRSLSRFRILLHAFAGRRRRGDIEWYIDRLAHAHPGFVIITVSIDIIIDSTHGDIAKREIRELWLGYISHGFVVGFLAGPPCNTWSHARHVQIDNQTCPRVVRTPDAPWGLNELRFGELQQVTIGTILLGFALECMLLLALRSGSGLLEHPKDSEDAEAVSIWRLPVIQFLLQLPGMRLVHLAQGLYGAPTAKPTTLLVLNMDDLESKLHSGRICPNVEKGVSIGKNAMGQFHTAPLKEYPPGLCKAIAASFTHNFCIQGTCVDHSTVADIPQSFLDLCYKMQDHDFGDYIGLD